ncbi:hypothetical protein TVAGG3_0196100 [Trichomonas vaginalis G3]|uniref:hypothetical protein n=1 Tax=Trichomonas vaginalis (strain ATCC PRA-98 / G3) TaxID=412133 RepID=UPI0021E57CFF|nr:hypothetical protein TVAGG3_0196100 [Trichomonas vaginalis G3]KAI5550308.1 hypothetical protein TVAGG3_0196100 [Trichomonas vaginalis G3]
MDAQNLANAQQPGQPNPESIPNEVRIQTAMANYGQVPTDVQMQTAMSNDAALGLPPWYANMRWKEFYTVSMVKSCTVALRASLPIICEFDTLQNQ